MTAIFVGIILILVFELIERGNVRKYNNTMYATKRNTQRMLRNIQTRFQKERCPHIYKPRFMIK